MNRDLILEHQLIQKHKDIIVDQFILIAGPSYIIRQDITKPAQTLIEHIQTAPEGGRHFEIYLVNSIILTVNCHTNEVVQREKPPKHTISYSGRTFDLTKKTKKS